MQISRRCIFVTHAVVASNGGAFCPNAEFDGHYIYCLLRVNSPENLLHSFMISWIAIATQISHEDLSPPKNVFGSEGNGLTTRMGISRYPMWLHRSRCSLLRKYYPNNSNLDSWDKSDDQ